ncbi:unnamed protein product [Dicrocoelium dendriticum]|nr:unnamed protein product [Dicrocoelium dendriticum]
MSIAALVFYLVLDLYGGIHAIRCASSFTAVVGAGLMPKLCDNEVDHCLITLIRDSGIGNLERRTYDCWPWQELKMYCPSSFGVCQMLHSTGDGLYSCCCYGDLCNNRTLQYLPITNVKKSRMTNGAWLGQFGIRDVSDAVLNGTAVDEFIASSMVLSYLAHIVLPCLAALLSVFTVGLSICYCTSTGVFRRKFIPAAFMIKPSSRDRSSKCNWLCSNHVFKLPSPPAKKHMKIPPILSNIGHGNHSESVRNEIVDTQNDHTAYYDTAQESTRTNSTGISAGSSIKSFASASPFLLHMTCRLERQLCIGRHAEIWLARLSGESPTHPVFDLSFQLNGISSDDDTASASTHSAKAHSSTELVHNTTQTFRFSSTRFPQRLPYKRVERFFVPKPNELLSGNCETLAQTNVHIVHSDFFRMSDMDHPKLGPFLSDRSTAVAVKIFESDEYRAWSTELDVFKALQMSSSTELPEGDKNRGHYIHPNVVKLIAAGTVSSSPLPQHLLLLEFAEGGSLRSLLSDGRWISPARCIGLVQDVVRGLAYLHTDLTGRCSGNGMFPAKPSVAHRDLKPENILLRADGTACLSDFGQAVPLGYRALDTTPRSCDSGLISNYTDNVATRPSILEALPKAGTLRYMAPELLDGAINFTDVALLRTDIYSLGLILWELLCAIHPNDLISLHCLADGSLIAESLVDHTNLDNCSCTAEAIDSEAAGSGHLKSTSVNKPRKHWLPYEEELGEDCSCPETLRRWVSVEKRRPMIHPTWCMFQPIVQLCRTITECWDPDPECRLTSGCVLERLNTLCPDLGKPRNHRNRLS